MNLTVSNGSIYDQTERIVEELSFILTIDKADETIVTLNCTGDHDDIVSHSLPRLDVMKPLMHIVGFTFSYQELVPTALSKEDQVLIVNYMVNHGPNTKTTAVAHAIHQSDIEALNTAFNSILSLYKN